MYTVIFTAFMALQMFNMLNSRKIEEINIFNNMNYQYYIFVPVQFGMQLLIVAKGGAFMRTTMLTWEQIGYCTAIGASSLVWAILQKLIIPASMFNCLSKQGDEDTQQSLDDYQKAPKVSINETN